MKPPIRWLDEPDALPDELLAGMQAYSQLGPSERELAQLRARLHTGTRTPWPLKWLGLVSVLAGLGGVVWSTRAPAPAHVPTAPAARPVVVPSATAIPAEVPRVETQAAAPPKPAPRKRVAAKEPLASTTNLDPATELALLRRARRTLASDPATTLALTEEHLHSYPAGVFAEERELLAIEALSQYDRARAIERAREFAAKYPRSVHQPRIEAALGAH